MKKTIAFILSLVMVLSMASLVVSAAAEYYPSGTVVFDENTVKDNLDKFLIDKTDGTVVYTEEGKLRFTSGAANTSFRYEPSPENLDTFTLSADVTLVENNYDKTNKNNALFQFGVRKPGSDTWGYGNMVQVKINTTSADQCQLICKNKSSGTSNVDWTGGINLTENIVIGGTFSVKLVLTDTDMRYYVNDNMMWSRPKEGAHLTSGDFFVALRQTCTFDVDNLKLVAGTTANADAPAMGDIATDNASVPTFQGYQLSAAYDSNGAKVTNVRFVATGSDLNVKKVGFLVTSDANGKMWNKSTATVWDSLIATTTDGNGVAGATAATYTAESYNAAYIYGLAIKGVPADTDVYFLVTPYVIDANDNYVYGATARVLVNVSSAAN